MHGMLDCIDGMTIDHIQGIPLPLFYDQLSRAIATRVRTYWLHSKLHSSIASQQKLDDYLIEITKCVSSFALKQHPQLIVVAIELAILTIIRLGTHYDTISTMQLLRHSECIYCKVSKDEHNRHKGLLCLIQELYSAQEVTLQSVSDSPDSSPLSALSNEGLDLGHSFMLVAKQMQWHGLALPEAQALAVCSEWMTVSNMPCTDEFFKKLSIHQADAESRALITIQNNAKSGESPAYIYDDIIDAWVAPESSQPTMRKHSEIKRNDLPLSLISQVGSENNKRRQRYSDTLPKISVQHGNYSQEDDEIDFLRNPDTSDFSRVRRKVRRLDVALEARRPQMKARTRRASLLPYL